MPRARIPIDSNRIEDGGGRNLYLVIEEAFHTVEIRPDQREDAQILSECILTHRKDFYFDSDAAASSRRDPKVIARILAIAPIEQLSDAIFGLKAERRKPGKTDMWYFSVLFDRIQGIDHKLTAAVIEQQKSKASYESKTDGGLFEAELLEEIMGNAKRIA